MKISTHCLGVCLIFYTYDSANFKSIGNNTMKMLLATALALLITGCAQQTFTVQNKPAAVAPKETITPSFLCVSGIQEENCRCSQNLWRRRNEETETQQTFVNGLLGFITLVFILRWKRVCIAHNNCMSCPSIWATLSALLINILLGSFQLFLEQISPSGE